MSFPYNTGDGSGANTGSGFSHWETLQHSPLDTPVPTPSSGTFHLDMEPMDLNIDPSRPQHQNQPPTDNLAPTIDNTPILLHHPTENPQLQQRHRPRAPSGTSTPSIHPIDALIFSRPGSASSTHTAGSSIHAMGMGHLLHQFAASPDPAGHSGSTPVPTPGPSSSKPVGAVRTTRARTAAANPSHPYTRQPPPAISPPLIPGIGIPTSGPTIMTRSKARKQSVKFADAPTTAPKSTGMGPMTHHKQGGMVQRPTTSSSGSASMQPLHRTGTEFFGTTVATGSSQQHQVLRDVAVTSSTSPAPPQMPTSGGGIGHRPSPPQATPQAPPRASTSTHHSSTSTARPRSKIPSHRLTNLPIHTDMLYSPHTHTLSCSLELPGVHPSHLRVSLGTCYFNHVKYVGVVGESVPVFGNESVSVGGLRGELTLEDEREEEARRGFKAELEGGIRSGLRRGHGDEREGAGGAGGAEGEDTHVKIGRIVNPNLRERKFGIFRRFIQVPSHTTPNDIAANLKHGVLTLHIYCGAPFEQDDEEEVPVVFE